MFAFLFDRGERGASKEEMVELIWPDTDLDSADVAFHRTLNALRTTLDPSSRWCPRPCGDVLERVHAYRLEPAVAQWSDIDAFDEAMVMAGSAAGPDRGHSPS